MQCPNCGQQQISDDVHFCRNCGFSLADNLMAIKSDSTKTASFWNQGIRRGAILFIIGALLTFVLATLWDIGAPLEVFVRFSAVASFAVAIFGVIQVIYALLFNKNASPEKQNNTSQLRPPGQPTELGRVAGNSALPPAQSIPVTDFSPPRNVNTKEMVSPASVTENTTKLLRIEQDK